MMRKVRFVVATLGLFLAPALATDGIVWGEQWGSPSWEAAFAASGRWVAGWTAGDLFAEGAGVDAFVVDAAAGPPRGWQSAWPGLERAYAIEILPDGYAWAGTVAAGAPDAMRAQTDALLVRMTAEGAVAWKATVGGPLTDEAHALAPAPGGGLYLAGQVEGRVYAPGAGGNDVFVARFDATGHRVWGVQWGTDDDDYLTAAAPDGAGGVYLAGYSDVDEDCRRVSERGFVLHYGPDGELTWVYRWGFDAASRPVALAADGAGVWVLGQTDGPLYGAFGGGRDVFVVHLSAGGAPGAGAQWGGDEADLAYALARADDGTLWVAGATANALFGPSAGGFDAFVARLGADGRPAAGWQAGSPARDEARALALTPDGPLVAGLTYGDLLGANAGQADAWAALLLGF
ncbi:hypothetical protein [Oceanithermus sp.]